MKFTKNVYCIEFCSDTPTFNNIFSLITASKDLNLKPIYADNPDKGKT